MNNRNTTEIIVGVLAVVSIILVAVESLVTVSNGVLTGIYIADGIICAVFAGDFVQRLRTSEKRGRFMKVHGYEILAMIPAAGFYALGAIPAISSGLRSLRLIRVIRVIVLLARMRRAVSTGGRFLERSHLLAIMLITLTIVLIGSFVILILEQGAETAEITNLSDAVWWTISTLTTVGYGDIVPNTIAGRVMGMLFMVVGIGVMAALISDVSAVLVEARLKKKAATSDLKTNIINEIKNRLDHLETLSDSDMSLLLQMIRTLRLKGEEQQGT